MKKNFYYAMISAALLTGAAGFSACSSDDVTEDTGLPGNAQEVKTEFAINIPRAGKAGRMTAENTQNNNNFLGMEDLKLIPFNSDPTAQSSIERVIGLGNIDGLDNKVDDFGTKKFTDVSIPVGTTHFQFFGHAPQGDVDPTKADDNFGKGILSDNLLTSSKLSELSFGLITTKLDDKNKESGTLLQHLNNLLDAQGGANSTWKSYAQDNANKNKELTELYNKFTKLKAGSANSIRLALENLYNAVASISADDKDPEEKKLATAIQEAVIGDLFKVSGDVSKGFVLAWNEGQELTYPKNINIPEGAVALTISTEEGANKGYFIYNQTTTIIGSTANNINIEKICFPASLYYAVSTPLWANSGQVDFPEYKDNWNYSQWLGWETVVKATTRRIALKNQIQYAVASLKLTVGCKTSNLPTNKQGSVQVPAEGYLLTGVLIGGQPLSVGYDFKCKDGKFEHTIFDASINEGVVAAYGKEKVANYTLVLPNVADNSAVVNFALEFTNKGNEFEGADGIVPQGGTFYLIGQLDPKEKNKPEGVDHVFQSDYETSANVTISSLANAYNTIPDLRATNLQLGLSVDLKWKKGFVFDVEIK